MPPCVTPFPGAAWRGHIPRPDPIAGIGPVSYTHLDVYKRQILANVLLCVEQVMEGIGPDQVAALAISNQRETTVLWDRKTGQPVCPVIVWQDIRSQALCDSLKIQSKRVKEITGLALSPCLLYTSKSYSISVSGLRIFLYPEKEYPFCKPSSAAGCRIQYRNLPR